MKIKKVEERQFKIKTEDNILEGDNKLRNIENSYVFIKNKNMYKDRENMDFKLKTLDVPIKVFNLLDEIAQREKLFFAVGNKKEKILKKHSFRDILLNTNKLYNDSKRRFKLKILKRKILKEEK
jgi:hypothetical protein